jgi:hypothetical protein
MRFYLPGGPIYYHYRGSDLSTTTSDWRSTLLIG